MKSAFHPEAREEFLAAVDLYNQVEPGFGLDFAGEINAAVELIEAVPRRHRREIWPAAKVAGGQGALRQNAGTRPREGQNLPKMAHGGGVSRRRAPFWEYLGMTAGGLIKRTDFGIIFANKTKEGKK